MRSVLPACLASGLLLGCAAQTVGDLPRPAIVVTVVEAGGFCSSTHVIDADGRVWLEMGCERSSGLVLQERSVSAAERAELDALLDRVLALPDDPGCEVPSPSARRFRFRRTLPGTDAWPDSRQCEPSVDADARELVLRAEALSAPPGADAGG